MAKTAPKPCHTCRRRRVKCDRSVPQCQKCAGAGLECLGYGKLILWSQGVASRGKMMGKTFGGAEVHGILDQNLIPPQAADLQMVPYQAGTDSDSFETPVGDAVLSHSLIDPLLQDLDRRSRRYISHFTSDFCQQLVIYDLPGHNPFRSLLQGIGSYPALRDMIIATAAYDLFNRFPADARPSTSYQDALVAKHRAINFLRSTLGDIKKLDINTVLTSIILLIHFELIDSGKDAWKTHIAGAQMLVYRLKSLEVQSRLATSTMTSMAAAYLISECIVYVLLLPVSGSSGSSESLTYPSSFDLIGSTLSNSGAQTLTMYEIEGFDPIPFLKLAEVNNCFSFPAVLLRSILDISRHQQNRKESDHDSEMKLAASMIETATQFNPFDWATSVQTLSPHKDVDERVRIASAHQAGFRLYISRTFPSNSPCALAPKDHQTLIADIIHHISQIDPTSNYFKCIVWPCFMVGAESDDLEARTWAMDRLRCYHDFIPWNYVVSCMDVLRFVWSKKTHTTAPNQEDDVNWLQEIRKMETDHFIA